MNEAAYRSLLAALSIAAMYIALPSEVAGAVLPKPEFVTPSVQWIAGLASLVLDSLFLQAIPIGKKA